MLVIATSSPVASAALFDGDRVIFSDKAEAAMRASEAIMRILQEQKERFRLESVQLVGADLGPGSFTGVKVGVTIAKSLAFAIGAKCCGFSAFDLISADSSAAIPSRKGRYLFREPGNEPHEIEASDDRLRTAAGYGAEFGAQTYPLAERARALQRKVVEPELLLPEYILEPSISTPKKPYGGSGC